MADNVDGTEAKVIEPTGDESTLSKTPSKTVPPPDPVSTQNTQKVSCKKHVDGKNKKSEIKKSKKKPKKVESSESESSDSDESSSSSSESEEEEDSEDEEEETSSSEDSERAKRKLRKSKAKAKKLKNKKSKKQLKSKKKVALDEESSEDDGADAVRLQAAKRAAARKVLKRRTQEVDSDGIEMDDNHELDIVKETMARMGLQNRGAGRGRGRGRGGWLGSRNAINTELDLEDDARILSKARAKDRAKSKEKKKRASKVAFKRVDQLWDQSIHNYKLTETVDDPDRDEWEQYIFTVRRKFDWEHKYQETFVDIKSKPLKDSLQHVMKDVKGVSLVQDTPHVDPNMLFLYLEECRAYVQELKQLSKNEKKKKARRQAATRAKHLKILVKYLDKDYAETKKTLYPMLANNTITFDLLWALFKPNTIAYCSTYGDSDQPRAFKIDFATKESHFMKGTWYSIEGKYLEYDGKSFGMGAMHTDVSSFQGARKISSLDCFPLQYHREADKMRTKLIERGKKFVALKGMHYRCHTGMAYTKRKRQILKININGRIMVDPAIHRRINPNYPISTVKPKEDSEYPDPDDSDSCECESSSDEENGGDRNTPSSSEENHKERKKFKIVQDEKGRHQLIEIDSSDEGEDATAKAKLDGRKDEIEDTFSDEELLIASPVVLGFAFSEKLWLEFTVSGISGIVWNEGAFDSLVLPDNQKSIVKALVSSHAFHPSQSIDDIISGKGKGLVAVLHGPPGTGKTLTAEGIADLLRCPLYMVSAGDLGTDPRTLEKELQNILDIAHSWGALLLLDEADVFLEKRSIHDIHRNALVSIFLRLLEYFQGILFLTTNRVETFDDAFVSRIHLSLRYGELTTKAKKTVWKMFIQRVKDSQDMEVENLTEEDFNSLSRRNLNGRQIKNLTRAAQALAVHEGKPMSMNHIKRVLDVAESFITDLKGGDGYVEAMRGYT